MKRRIQWMAAVLLAGSAAMAIGGPNIGPYGPWNSGGAYGGFGPYDPYVARGYRVQEGLPAVAEIVNNDCAIPSRRVMVSESLPVVAERVSSDADLVMTDQTVPITSRVNCIGGREFITTTNRIRPVRVQRTFVANGDLAPVGERVVTYRPAARERLLPVGERFTDNCDLMPVRERRLLPVRERIIRTSSFRPFRDNCDLAPVAERRYAPIRERRLLPVRERLIRTSSFRDNCDLAPVAERRYAPIRERRLLPVRERLIRTSSFRDNCDLAPVGERRFFPIRERRLLPVRERLTTSSFRDNCDLAPVAERRGFWPFASRRQPIVINTEVITTTTRWNTNKQRSGKKLAPVAEKSCGMKKHHFTKKSKKHIMPVGEKVLIHKKSMIKRDRPLYPSAGNDYVNPYR